MTEKIGSVNIRAIQHYMYCPRRFALLEINTDWAENASVVKANLMHENVHEGDYKHTFKDKIVRTSVSIYNDLYDIFGVADCVEFIRRNDGVVIPGLEGLFHVRIVEYKPKPPNEGDYHESDVIQVFAQKVCADFVWNCNCEAYIYYGEKRRRVELPFKDSDFFEKYNNLLTRYLSEMRGIMESGAIPPKRKTQNCSGCSLADCCFAKSINYHVEQRIYDIARGDL